MSYSAYNLPVFSSSERLAALARFVSDTNANEADTSNNVGNAVNIITTVDTPTTLPSVPPRATPIEKIQNIQMGPGINAVNTTNVLPWLNSTNLINDNNSEDEIVPSNPNKDLPISSVQNQVSQTKMFTVLSAGFHHGNFSEFKLDQRVFIPRVSSKRGITVLYMINDLKTFHAWNFDFYKSPTKLATNRNFISLLRRLPGDTYFAMSIKDDAHRNLFEGTKNFLSRIIGCKTIWRLTYRNSWCAIVYKRTEKSFEVVSESHNPSGIAVAQYPIIDKNVSITPITPINPPNTTKAIANSLWKPSVSEPISHVTENHSSQLHNQYPSNMLSAVSTLPLQTISQTQPVKEPEKDIVQDIVKELSEKSVKLTKEVRELKQLVLDQTKLIKQLLESKKDKESN